MTTGSIEIVFFFKKQDISQMEEPAGKKRQGTDRSEFEMALEGIGEGRKQLLTPNPGIRYGKLTFI